MKIQPLRRLDFHSTNVASKKMERVKKVVAYIVRDTSGKRELLVFRHRDYPDAGLQVPAGTVQEGEDIQAALMREVTEETGLELTGEPVTLGVFDYFNSETGKINERHVFLVTTPEEIPDRWEWLETGEGEMPEGYVFCFEWADLSGVIELAGSQGDYLDRLREL